MLPTPFLDDGLAVDLESVGALTRAMAERGCDLVVAHGVIGEPEMLSPAERLDVVRAALDVEGVPVVPTITAATTSAAADECRGYRAEFGERLTHVLVPVMSSDPVALEAHLVAVTDDTGYRVLLQDYPRPTGIEIAIDDLQRVARPGGVVDAVKEEAPDATSRIAHLSAAGIDAVAGLGGVGAIGALAAGATGLAAGISIPQALARVLELWDPQAPEGASAALDRAIDVIRLETTRGAGSVGIRKEHWRRQSVIHSAAVRRPGASWSADLDEDSRTVLAPWL